jgi:hypothetical protein
VSALTDLATQLREEDTPISPRVADPSPDEAFAPDGDYAYVLEAVREGYLLHYGEPRLLAGHDDDLALLAGDYLYALGIERLAAMGDTDAVLTLANLISASAQLHAEHRAEEVPGRWRETTRAIGSGPVT